MSKVTIYLDEETEKRMKLAAESAGMPVSRWVAETIRLQIRTKWPSWVHELPGSWDDIQRAEFVEQDLPRAAL